MSIKKPNRLINEKSPYLLQHAHNPVDWYAWGEEAFTAAKNENKPIFLSIGYSTCHWCHVMEKESFEDEEVAALMNDTFVSIKVDREERPDIDGIYMTVCQAITGSGGWPLTVIMTPEQKPFFAGTYFPKEDRFGRMGMINMAKRIKKLWQTNKEQLLQSADEISGIVEHANKIQGEEEISKSIFDKAYTEFNNRFDSEFGGFGTAPKFPTPHNLSFLLRYWKRSKDEHALQMVQKTLTRMREGGIFDQLGFGFHRYSTDKRWLVPHFEKMLYDQAQLVEVYIEIYQATKKELYKKTAEEILEYVQRDMTSPEGGFYSAEDADSEGVEGKFYLWEYEEVKEILDDEDFNIFPETFNVFKDGNWIESVREGKKGTNILHTETNIAELSQKFNLSADEIKNKLEKIRKKLFDEREKRIHPFKDDKILTDWNGMMISAFSKAYQVSGKKNYKEAAEKAFDFVRSSLMNNEGRLFHRFRNNEKSILGNLDDYAFFIKALLDLYESTFKTDLLALALRLNDDVIKLFADEENGGFFFTSIDSEKLLARQKEIYDGAVPSGNSIMMLNLLRIARITGKTEFESRALQLSKTFSKMVNNSPAGFTQLLNALDFAFGPTKEIIVISGQKSKDFESMLDLLNSSFFPNKTLIVKYEDDNSIVDLAGYLSDYRMLDVKTTVYICENYVCNQPITDVTELEKYLKIE